MKFPNRQQFGFLDIQCTPNLSLMMHDNNEFRWRSIYSNSVSISNDVSKWATILNLKPIVLNPLSKLYVNSSTLYHTKDMKQLDSSSVFFDIIESQNNDNKKFIYTQEIVKHGNKIRKESNYVKKSDLSVEGSPLTKEILQFWNNKDIEKAYKYFEKKAIIRTYMADTLYAVGHSSVIFDPIDISKSEFFDADLITDDLDKAVDHCYKNTKSSIVNNIVFMTCALCATDMAIGLIKLLI